MRPAWQRRTLPGSMGAGELALALGVLLAAASPAAAETPVGHPLLRDCGANGMCTSAQEARALADPQAAARRERGVLRVGRDEARLQHFDDTEAGRFLYLGPLGETGLHLVQWLQAGQPARYRLAGPGSPPDLVLDAAPWPSADGRLIAVAVPAGNGAAGSLTVLQRVGVAWRLLYRYEPAPGLGFAFRGWRADGAAMRLDWACAAHSGVTPVQLRDGPFGWDLVPPTPPACP